MTVIKYLDIFWLNFIFTLELFLMTLYVHTFDFILYEHSICNLSNVLQDVFMYLTFCILLSSVSVQLFKGAVGE